MTPSDDRPDIADAAAGALLAKVRKLLAKAEATDNPNEADAFSSKAAELIAAHRIDASRLAETASGDRMRLRAVPMGRGAYVRARLALLGAVAAHHDCELVWQSGPDGATAHLAGHGSDLDAVVALYESLHLQATNQLAGIRRATPAATQRWRRAFLFGFASRLSELLGAARLRAEAATPGGPSVLPDVPSRAEQARRFAVGAFGRVVAAKAPSAAVTGGWDHGHGAADGADIGRTRLRDGARPAIGRGA